MTTNVTIKNEGPGKVIVVGIPPGVDPETDTATRPMKLLNVGESHTMAVFKEQQIIVSEI